MFPAEEYAARRARVYDELKASRIDLAVVTHQADLFYLSGTCQAGYLFLQPSGHAWLAARRGAVRAGMETGLIIEEFRDTASLAAAIDRHGERELRRIGLGFDVSPHDLVLRLQKILPRVEQVDLGPFYRQMRRVKSPAEVELIRLAGRQLDGAFKTAASLLRLGQSELELAIRLEAYLRRKGHPGQVRVRRAGSPPAVGFVAAGANTLFAPEFDAMSTGSGLSPAMPCGPGDREFRAGETILFDYFGCCAGYMADMTRMLSLGAPPSEAAWAYEAMRQVLRRLEPLLSPGTETGLVYDTACRESRLLGYDDCFLQSGGRWRLPFVGHGLGLELDEPPFLAAGRREALEPGMILAVEPKVFLPGIGVVGVENTYLITEDGCECLTKAEEEWRVVPVE